MDPLIHIINFLNIVTLHTLSRGKKSPNSIGGACTQIKGMREIIKHDFFHNLHLRISSNVSNWDLRQMDEDRYLHPFGGQSL